MAARGDMFDVDEFDGPLVLCLTFSTGKEKVRSTWTSPADFNEVVVHPMMLFDHLPDVVYRALRKLQKQTNGLGPLGGDTVDVKT